MAFKTEKYHGEMKDTEIITKRLAALFAIASGLAVGNLYWAQPLLAAITDSFGIATSRGGLLITATQIGYAAGILLLLPLGDILRRRRLIFVLILCSSAALVACAAAPSFAILAAALSGLGVVTISGQIILPLTGDLSEPEERGHLVGIVSSGIVTGILFSRFVSGIVAAAGGWRMIYVFAAVLNLIMAFIVYMNVPEVEAKEKVPYTRLIKDVFTSVRRYPILPLILLQTGMVFGITFNLFWTGLTFLLSADPFGYDTFRIGLLSLVGLSGAAGGMWIGRLRDRGYGIPALGLFIAADGVCMVSGIFAERSIIAIAVIGAVFSLVTQGVSILCQARLFDLSDAERSRLNSVFVVSNFAFCAVGSTMASVLWEAGGWSAVMTGGAAAALVAAAAWLAARKSFRAMDENSSTKQ